jgi:hypothetical protein
VIGWECLHWNIVKVLAMALCEMDIVVTSPRGLVGCKPTALLLSGPPATAFLLSPNRYSNLLTDSMPLPDV